MANQIKNIAIKNLTLWDENARFPDKYFNQEESELIDYFLSNPEFKIKSFLQFIVQDFDLPQLENLVVWNNGEQNIVLEGNRRLTVYKLLNNPKLSKDLELQKFIENEKQKISISDDFELACVLVDDKEDAYRYITRKHYNGNNEVSWKETERAHYSRRRGNQNKAELTRIGISKIIRDLDLPEQMKEKVLGKGYETTFYRIISGTPAKEEFGYSFDEQGNLIVKDDQFKEKLKVIVYSVLNKKDIRGNAIDSRALNKNDKIESFIKSINIQDSQKVDEEMKSKTRENIFGDQTILLGPKPTKQKVFPKTTSRKHLIPKSCSLRIESPKINNIYRELRDNLLLDDTNSAVPNAVGVLFRVFLEISIDYYAQMNQNCFKSSNTISQKISWVIDNMKSKGYNNKIFKNIQKVGSASGDKTYLSIHNFHEYVHSTTTQPSPNELKMKWDNLQPFFETLWEDLNKK